MDDFVNLLNYGIAFFSLFVVNFFLLVFLIHRKDCVKETKKTKWRPFVSIVVPAYNEGKYIHECLESIVSVDYPRDKLDVIIVDDGSSDSTYEIVKKFIRSNNYSSFMQVVTKKNAGKGAALNFGIAKAKGELVATMDADSYLTKNTILELLPLLSDPEVMAVTPAVKVRESNAWLKELQRVEYLMILFSRKLLSFIDSVPVTPGPFSLFRASVFEKVGLFDEHNLVEDQEIALRIQKNNFKIKSSITADVYTEPPDHMSDLLKQRIRWQRGGLRNYWNYRGLISPKYGDFGIYFVPLNFASITAFFLVLGLLIYSIVATPTYVKYIWVDSLGLSIGLFTFVSVFVVITSIIFLWVAITSFKNEKVKLRYLFSFMVFYWYLMVGYNVLTLVKELRREKDSW